MTVATNSREQPAWLENHVILKALTGSRAHGTALEGADEDLRGVIIAPHSFYMGLDSFEQYESVGTHTDIVYFELRKFIRLAMKGNPAVYSIFAGPKLDRKEPWATEILDLWPLVVSKRLVGSHIGMARAHMARLEYPGKNCGVKGREALARHGYNTKDAAHTIRVLEQCLEMLETGRMAYPRPNVSELLEIKLGGWTLARVKTRADELIDAVREMEKATSLPDHPDEQLVSKHVASIVWRYLGDNICVRIQ